MTSVTELERIAASGWPGTENRRLGGWLLRAGNGFTGRANSVLPLGSPGMVADEGIATVRAFYRDRGLPARFQIPAGTPHCGELDSALDRLGWVAADEAAMLVAELTDMLDACSGRPDLPTVELADAPSPE